MKAFNDLIKPVRAISPVSVSDNTAAVSQIIDTQGFSGLEFLIPLGSLADADATFAVTLDEGDAANLSDAASVAASNLDGTLAAASFIFSDDDTVKKIGVKELTKRYYRLTITPTNNSSAALICAVAILFAPRKAPTS